MPFCYFNNPGPSKMASSLAHPSKLRRDRPGELTQLILGDQTEGQILLFISNLFCHSPVCVFLSYVLFVASSFLCVPLWRCLFSPPLPSSKSDSSSSSPA